MKTRVLSPKDKSFPIGIAGRDVSELVVPVKPARGVYLPFR